MKKGMEKRLLALIVSLAMVGSLLMGCSGSDGGSGGSSDSGSGDGETYKIGITVQSLSNAYWAGVMSKLEELLEEKGLTTTYWDRRLERQRQNSSMNIIHQTKRHRLR